MIRFNMNGVFCISMIAFCILITTNTLAQQVIPVKKLSSRPVIDGSIGDWKNVAPINISLKGKSNIGRVTFKAGVFGDEVYFMAQWKDPTESTLHRPHVWDSKKKKYVGGKQREDRFALQFAMEGDYSADWLSGKTFKADMWHWKANRSNPVGLAHDKMTIISRQASRKAFQIKDKNGKFIYIRRPSDTGEKIYKSRRYSKKEKDVMPKYVLNKDASGSIADIKAKGVWKNGMWTLELKRKLNTSHGDDAVFRIGKKIKGAIAVYDASCNDCHDVSQTLVFQF